MRRLAIVMGLALAACGGAKISGNPEGGAGLTGEDAGSEASAGEGGGFMAGQASDAAGGGDGSSGPTGDAGGIAPNGDAGTTTPTAICGTSLLLGPSSAPAGAVTVSPGATTIQDAISQHPGGGTTYYLTAGTYSISSSINPNDNDSFIGAPGAIIDGANTQQVAFGLNDHASGVTVKYLTIQHFAGVQNNGIVNQGQGAGWTLQYDTIQNNPDTNAGANGIELGDDNIVSYNCLMNNGQTGISSDGGKRFVVDHNEVSFNADGYEAAHPCGCSGGMKFFTSTNGTVTNNWIHDNGNVGLWVDTNNSFFLIQGNTIEDSYAEGIMYEISYNAVIADNVIRYNGIGANRRPAISPSPPSTCPNPVVTTRDRPCSCREST